MNTIIGLKELRQNAETYIKKVGRGDSFIVVRRSKPIFKIVPVDEWGDSGKWDELLPLKKYYPRGIDPAALLAMLRVVSPRANLTKKTASERRIDRTKTA